MERTGVEIECPESEGAWKYTWPVYLVSVLVCVLCVLGQCTRSMYSVHLVGVRCVVGQCTWSVYLVCALGQCTWSVYLVSVPRFTRCPVSLGDNVLLYCIVLYCIQSELTCAELK